MLISHILQDFTIAQVLVHFVVFLVGPGYMEMTCMEGQAGLIWISFQSSVRQKYVLQITQSPATLTTRRKTKV